MDKYGWEWVFYINVPFCIVGMLMVSAFVHDPPYLKRGVERIDWTGITLLTVGLTAAQMVLERGEEVDWFASNWIIIGTVVAAVGIVGLLIWELNRSEPIIDFRFSKIALLSVGCAIGSATGFALFGSSFLLPQFTENLLNYPAYQAGLVLMPRALAMFLVMPIIGAYTITSVRACWSASGSRLLMYGYWRLAHFNLDGRLLDLRADPGADRDSGMGFAMVTFSTISLSTVPRPQMTGASGLNTLTRREAGNIAYALLATVLARRTQFHRAMLVSNVSDFNQRFLRMDQGLTQSLQKLWLQLGRDRRTRPRFDQQHDQSQRHHHGLQRLLLHAGAGAAGVDAVALPAAEAGLRSRVGNGETISDVDELRPPAAARRSRRR